ncbi:MAG TPA: hypothetical protein VFT70_06305 [Nocardioides sp.]|nr:hypothetical protein [Nocardioides sp.]
MRPGTPRRLLQLGVLAVVLVATTLLLSWGSAPRVPRGHNALQLSECVVVEPVDTVADLNRFVRRTPGVPGMRGADVGIDLLLADGRRLWFFADTLQSDPDLTRFVHNSALLTDGDCVRAVSGPGRSAVIPDRFDGVGYWPMSGFTIERPRRTTVVVLSQRVRAVGPGSFGFEILGPSVAVIGVPHGRRPQLRRITDLGPDLAAADRPTWGAALARVGHRVYLYGTSTRPISGVHGFALHVARTRVADIADARGWHYWDGTGWNGDPARATPVVGELGGVSQTLSVFPAEGRWWILSKQDEFLGTSLAVWPADHPWGPFEPPIALLDIPCNPSTGELRYLALAHPDLLPRPGTMVVSWSRNNPDVFEVCQHPGLYRPRFDRVRLPAD